MQATSPVFAVPLPPVSAPISVPDLRYRIADLLAQIEADNESLAPADATQALLETAFGAALTFCSSPDRARQHMDSTIEGIHTDHLHQSGGTQKALASSVKGRTSERARSSLRTATHSLASPGRFHASQRAFLAVAVAILSWATVVFLAHRGQLSAWNLLGPLFCTLLAMISGYRFLVLGGHMRHWAFLSRGQRLRLQ
jgi:hypothetical protein